MHGAYLFVPPQIRAEGGGLAWETPRLDSIAYVTPADRLISDFVKLASKTSNEPFVKFARRYGVFHAKEKSAGEESPHTIVLGNTSWTVRPHWINGTNWEPLEFWRELSRNVRAILRIAAALNEYPPRLGHPDDWGVLLGGEDRDPGFAALKTRGLLKSQAVMGNPRELFDYARFFLQEVVINKWLRVGRVGLEMHSDFESKGRIIWHTRVTCGRGLFGAIALQLMLLFAGAEALDTCAGCGLPYIRTGRRPKRGQNSYCDDCGLESARRDADRRRKDKMIEARRLHAKGATPEKIARRLSVRSVATVRRWLKKGKPNVKKAGPR
jgi:hypothetical protein